MYFIHNLLQGNQNCMGFNQIYRIFLCCIALFICGVSVGCWQTPASSDLDVQRTGPLSSEEVPECYILFMPTVLKNEKIQQQVC